MSEVITIGLDLAKNIFHVHSAGENGDVIFGSDYGFGVTFGQWRDDWALRSTGPLIEHVSQYFVDGSL